jgi:hypothetical protein
MDIRVGDVVRLRDATVTGVAGDRLKLDFPDLLGEASSSKTIVSEIVSRKETDAEARVRLEAQLGEVERLNDRVYSLQQNNIVMLEARVQELEKLNQSLVAVPMPYSLRDRLLEARQYIGGMVCYESIVQSLDDAIAGLERKAAL